MSDETPAGPALPLDPTRRAAAVRIPFPARLNRHAERARQHTLQWAQGMGLLTGDVATAEYDALRLERLMAYFYPDATAAGLELAADFNAWFFIFDDQFDGGLGTRPEEIRRVVDTLVGTMTVQGHPPAGPRDTSGARRAGDVPGPGGEQDTPLVRAFRDIWLRSTASAPNAWRLRFREHWRAYLAAHEGEARQRNAERPPSFEQFLDIRRDSIGVRPCLDFTERCGGYTLPDDLHGWPALREMREITGDVVIFVNDIVSLLKELAVGDVNNSVVVHRAHKGCTIEESVEYISALANTRTDRFEQLAAVLPGTLDRRGVPRETCEHVSHYVDGMRHLMAGNLAWSLATSRYDETGVAAASGGPRPWSRLIPGVSHAPR
ncbi:avermitilol synthase [Streptomyces sp. DvalAA-14]|uniref:isoafricanol synthase n=1 Tax=unclassified Streptomyces TaxID=2593676 RepID=UPI00081B8CD5|nr:MULTISPECIES: isoafricanol synthase [unclassified Streptomyces]MYS19741.1 pentalenene synthase [Streptomyces sp. SID4948]SCD52076.1 avermitilol synthase [Streptomyces sp. DvalAA-14]